MLYLFIAWNLFVLFLYGLDKHKAVKAQWRIKEATLILSAFVFGGAGAMFGMVLFNHKTSKMKFRLLVPLALLLNIAFFFVYFQYRST